MDLTPLRPSVTFLSGKARKQGCISRSVIRPSTWIAACRLGPAERLAAPRRLLASPFAPLSCTLHRLFALVPTELAENTDRPISGHFAEDNWLGQRSEIPPRNCQELSSIHVDLALWRAFCSMSGQLKWTPGIWGAAGIACVRETNG